MCIEILVQPSDPGNLGSILRTLDAIGGGALLVLNGAGIRATHGSPRRARRSFPARGDPERF